MECAEGACSEHARYPPQVLLLQPRTARRSSRCSVPLKQIQPDPADLKRRNRPSSAKFGSEKRFRGGSKYNETPGPVYNPPFDPKRPESAKFSFGYRREIPGYSPIVATIGTNPIVGPTTYFKANKLPLTSRIQSAPAHKVPGELRFKKGAGKTNSETYEE